ncbi:MAG: hypothetical protein EOO04_02740 [Chitinophagaceae bacterium]|nr:MAG: hypothetical protein EOO04_02740 [Chitinophagaceae bacterium]
MTIETDTTKVALTNNQGKRQWNELKLILNELQLGKIIEYTYLHNLNKHQIPTVIEILLPYEIENTFWWDHINDTYIFKVEFLDSEGNKDNRYYEIPQRILNLLKKHNSQ